MAQRFNPPPGWNVPPDFVPAEGWQPDPSWPPAPEGWTYWVDDAAPDASSSFGQSSAPQAPGYGTQTPAYGQVDGSFGSSSAPAYGSPDQDQTGGGYNAGAPVGGYGTVGGGSAQTAVAEGQLKAARTQIFIGIGVLVLTIVVFVAFDRLFYLLPIVSLVMIIKGAIDMGKARKAIAASQGFSTGGGTPPGVGTPPSSF